MLSGMFGGLNGDGFEPDFEIGGHSDCYINGEDNWSPHSSRPVKCKKCGQRGLYWRQTSANNWVLSVSPDVLNAHTCCNDKALESGKRRLLKIHKRKRSKK